MAPKVGGSSPLTHPSRSTDSGVVWHKPSTKEFGERISPSIGGDSESAVWRICVLGGLPHRKSAAREGGSNPLTHPKRFFKQDWRDRQEMMSETQQAYINTLLSFTVNAPVAQLDRASDFESEGRGFESLRARLKK